MTIHLIAGQVASSVNMKFFFFFSLVVENATKEEQKKVESCFIAQCLLVDNKVSNTYSLVSYLC